MMAVSLPTGGLNKLDTTTGNANDVMCSLGSEDCFQSISKEQMEQIRNTMIRHEELFREQVQALHELYKIQKLAMQEIRKAIYSQARMMAFNSETISDWNSQPHRSAKEGKPSRSDSVTSQDYREVHVTAKEITSCDLEISLSMSNTNLKTLSSVTNKPRREIDLERPPEDYMEDSEIQDEVNGHLVPDASTHLSEEALKTNQGSHVGSKFLSVLQMGSPNLNRIDPSPQSITFPVPRRVDKLDFEAASETKIDERRFPACVQNLNEASHNSKLKEFLYNHLPALGNSPVHDESSPSPDHNAEKPSWLYEGGSAFVTHRLQSSQGVSVEPKHHPEMASDQVKEGSNPVSTEVCQMLQSSLIHTERDYNRLNDLCVQPATSLDANSVLRNKNSAAGDITCQTSENGGNENLNCIFHGNNDSESHGSKFVKNGSISIFKIKSDLTFEMGSSEPVQLSQVAVGGVEPETEARQFTNVDIEPSLSSTIPEYEANHMDHSDSPNGNAEILNSQKESAPATESNEDTKNETTLEEACESIAAQILLSFAPSRSQDDSKGKSYQTQRMAESSGLITDGTGHQRKRSLRARRSINYNDGAFIDGTEKWTESLQGRRRRTLRRAR